MKLGPTLPPQVRVYAAFFIYALALGAIYPRIGDLQLAMNVGEGALGLALIGPGIGAFVALTFAAPLLERVSHKNIFILGNFALIFLVFVATFAPSPEVLFVILFGAGLTTGALEVAVNLEADRTEHAIGRGIMSRCHAFWSFGFFTAGLLGALAKQWGLSPQLHVGLMVPLVLLASIIVLNGFAPAPSRPVETPTDTPKFAMPTPAIWVLVAFALAALFLEGAGYDWSVIYMRESFGASPFVNGLAIVAGALTQGICRFFADRFIMRLGPMRLARWLISILGLGTILVVIAPNPALALFGFALMGVGTSAVFPLGMSAAAQRTDRPATQNIAAFSQFAFVAFLIGPPALGFVAEAFGLRYAFAVCLPLVLLSLWATKGLPQRPVAGE
jgi:MFS family permease